MSDPGRGGRGKQAPYRSTHYRIPEPIKPTVEKLAATYRLLVLSEFDHQGKALLNRVDDAIAVSSYPEIEPDTSPNGNPKPGTKLIEGVKPGTTNTDGEVKHSDYCVKLSFNHPSTDELDKLKADSAMLQPELEEEKAQRNHHAQFEQLILSHQAITQSLSAEIQALEAEKLAFKSERLRLEQELNDLHLELTSCKEQIQAQPPPAIVSPLALALLREALTLKPNAGGAIKRKVEKAIALLDLDLRAIVSGND